MKRMMKNLFVTTAVIVVLALTGSTAQAATLTLTPNTGPNGTAVTAKGAGFSARIFGTLTVGEQLLGKWRASKGGTGTWTLQFNWPPGSANGPRTVVATSSNRRQVAQAIFTVTGNQPPPPPRLRQVDGGTGYYGQFSRPLPTSPGYFPIAGWVRKAESQSHFDRYAEFGMNTFVGVEAPEFTNEALIRQAGMRAFIQADERTRFDDLGSETAGWLLADEIDMTEGPSACNGSLNNIIAGLPQDGRALYNNYGKGVLLWETNAQASCFVNKQDVTSTDLYWHTDPNQTTMVAPPFLPEFDPDPDEEWISGSTVKRSANYGYQVDRLRQLDAMDGERQPIWNFVELGWPWSEPASNADRIQPAELRAAVWHSIIAGARGIIYFDHNFNGPCGGSTILGQCYADTRAMAKSVNAQIRQLAPVLNAPFDDSYATASPSVRIMSKHLGGVHYVFAASRQNAASTSTFTVRTGTVATVVGEGRSIPITNGRFTDTFADGNAVHIYRIG